MGRVAGSAPVTRSELLKTALFVGSGLLVGAVFYFTQQNINSLSREVATTSRVLARFCAQASFPATRDSVLRKISKQVIDSIDFPIVITDIAGNPRAWHHVGVDPDQVPDAALDSLFLGRTISPVIQAHVDELKREIAALDRKNLPIAMTQTETGMPLGAVHYGEPGVLERLRWMPFLSAAGVVLLLALGLLGLRGSAGDGADLEVRLARAELAETLDEMENDIARLSKVAQRFSHVGSVPLLQLQDVTPVVREAVQYARRRLPHGEGGVEIRERYEEVPRINVNRELLEWALENLLSNALSAIERRPGVIEVTVKRRKEAEEVEVVVRDNGRGMAPSEHRRVFEPGYTTKRRGWGLGLALARRVVEDYHGGRLWIRHSAPGLGTTMVISFPT